MLDIRTFSKNNIAPECAKRCRALPKCNWFSIDYADNTCFSFNYCNLSRSEEYIGFQSSQKNCTFETSPTLTPTLAPTFAPTLAPTSAPTSVQTVDVGLFKEKITQLESKISDLENKSSNLDSQVLNLTSKDSNLASEITNLAKTVKKMDDFCPSGWVDGGPLGCYFVANNSSTMTYFKAKKFCQSMDKRAHLVEIRNLEIQEFIGNMDLSSHKYWWTGAILNEVNIYRTGVISTCS